MNCDDLQLANWSLYIHDKLLETLLKGLLQVSMASQYFKDTQMRGWNERKLIFRECIYPFFEQQHSYFKEW